MSTRLTKNLIYGYNLKRGVVMKDENNLGTNFKNIREEKKIERNEIAYKANIDLSHLSRIENNQTQPAAPTFVALCNALVITTEEAYNLLSTHDISDILSNEKPPLPSRQRPSSPGTLVKDDILIFLDLLEDLYGEAINLLSDLISLIIPKDDENKISYQTSILFDMLFDMSRIELQVKYPDINVLERIDNIYFNEGVFTLTDAGHYLRALRNEKKLTTQEVSLKSKVSVSTINRVENAKTERIRIEDIWKIDQGLKERRKLFTIFWHAYEFYNDLIKDLGDKYQTQQKEKFLLMTIMINGFRWLQLDGIDQTNLWLEQLRRYKY